jgi:hypothetical protein
MHDGAVTSNSAGQYLNFVLAFAFLWNSQAYDAKQKKEWSITSPTLFIFRFQKKRPLVIATGHFFIKKNCV